MGLSGSGKSTIANLIVRFYDNYNGQILIENKDIKKIELVDLRNNVSMVTQETILFNDSIANNIKYGKLDASEEEIKNVAKTSGISEFSENLENQLDTVIGESGVKLSGGQRQRIAIARAILKNGPILIMDEATSSLDNITEKEVLKTIKNLMKDKTTLIIAHRLSTIEDCDSILLFDKGELKIQGDINSLKSSSKQFKEMLKKNEKS